MSGSGVTKRLSAMDDKPTLAHNRLETIGYPGSGQVALSGRLFARYQGNQRYLMDIYERKKDWMLEPFRNRGQAWVLEPLRNQKQELNWAGEYAGKWLDAAAVTAASSHDEGLGECAGVFATALIATQESDGYLGIEAPAQRAQAEWDIWNVKYSMTGLLTHYEVYRAEASLRAATRAGEWLINRYGVVFDSNNPFFHSPSEGGVSVDIIDQLVRLYRFTHDRKFLNFVSSVLTHFSHVVEMRSTRKAPLTHAYMLSGYLGGVAELAALDDFKEELPWVEGVWEDVIAHHVYPTGSLGYREHLMESAPNDTPVDNGQPERHHQETCATVEWLLLNARLHQATGGVRYVQSMEQTIYNALLAAQSADGMNWMYYTPLRYEKRWFTGPTSCCYWSGPRGIAHLPEWIYALDGDGIRVNLYESSEALLQLDRHDVAIQQVSRYPDSGTVTVQIQPEKTRGFTLRLRIPFRSGEARLKLNGRPFPAQSGADGYYSIRRQWSKGDQLVMEFDIPVAVHYFLNNQYGVLLRGPEVLAVDQRDNGSRDLDQLKLREGLVLRSIDPVGGRRRYIGELEAEGRPAQVVFTPYADCGDDGARFRTAFPVT